MARRTLNKKGPRYPLEFDVVNVNVGNVWNDTLNMVKIAVTGTYYLHVDTCTCSTEGNILEVRVNGVTVFYVKAPYMVAVGAAQNRGNAALQNLNAGDSISITMPAEPSSCVFGGNFLQTSFHGLLLAPR